MCNQNQNQNILLQTTRSIYTNITTYKIDTDIQKYSNNLCTVTCVIPLDQLA